MYFQWRREWTAPSVVGVIAFGIGAGAGYAFSKYQHRLSRKVSDALDELGSDVSHLQTKMEENGTKVLEAAWDIITNMNTKDDKSEPTSTMRFLVKDPDEKVELSSAAQFLAPFPHEEVDTPQGETSNIWLGDAIDKTWDMEAENQARIGKEIYILHRDEFDHEEMGYNHTTITYYAGDDILTDERDVPIHNYTTIIGEGNLIFGKGTGDPSIVYIRNTRIESEMEVILDHGYFQVEVLGQELEDQLSVEKSRVPKFRDD
jgi:hypothetical protein